MRRFTLEREKAGHGTDRARERGTAKSADSASPDPALRAGHVQCQKSWSTRASRGRAALCADGARPARTVSSARGQGEGRRRCRRSAPPSERVPRRGGPVRRGGFGDPSRVLDHDDHPHPSPTVRAGQHVDRERAAHEGGPGPGPVAERGRGALPALGATGNTRYPRIGLVRQLHVTCPYMYAGLPIRWAFLSFGSQEGPGMTWSLTARLPTLRGRNRSKSGSARLGQTRANRPDSRPNLTAAALWRRDGVRAENPGVGYTSARRPGCTRNRTVRKPDRIAPCRLRSLRETLAD